MVWNMYRTQKTGRTNAPALKCIYFHNKYREALEDVERLRPFILKCLCLSVGSRRRGGPAAVLVGLPEKDSRAGLCGGLL